MKHSKYKQVPTFSQRHGPNEMPIPPRLGEISPQARNFLWAALWDQLHKAPKRLMGSHKHNILVLDSGPWKTIYGYVRQVRQGITLDKFIGSLNTEVEFSKSLIWSDGCHKCFDFMETIMRHPDCPREFIEEVSEIFRYQLAYRIDTSSIPTIICAATKEEGDCLLRALHDLQRAGLEGAAEHLRRASQRCRAKDWAGSVRESISAVESVARKVATGSAGTLAEALKSLGRQHSLHPALKEGFLKLYGYTSDEPGIRHALSDSESKVGQDEALYMIGACAAFSSYLWRKFGVQEEESV